MPTWCLRRRREENLPENILYCDTAERCVEAARRIAEWDVCGVDTEAYGADIKVQSPVNHQTIISIQFATDTSPLQVFVPLWNGYLRHLEIFREFLESHKRTKVLHNYKYDAHVLANHGVHLNGLLGDTLVMHVMQYSGEQFHGLKPVIENIFNEYTVEYKETFQVPILKKNGEPSVRMRVPSLTEVIQTREGRGKLIAYGGKDPWYTARLYRYLAEKMRNRPWVGKRNYLECYETFDLPYTEVLFEMERRGCLIDLEQVERAHHDACKELEELEGKILKEGARLGVPHAFLEEFNIGSGPQLATLLEEHLGVFIQKRTPTGRPCVDADSLEAVHDRKAKKILDLVLEWRGLEKLRSAYLENYGPLAKQYDGRLHTTFRQTGAVTGRLSSSAVNLQVIPRLDNDKFGLRKMFIAPQGMVVGDIDLSQIEVRIAAHVTQDPVLLKAIKEDWDIHALTATRISSEVQDFCKGKVINAALLKEVKEKFKVIRDRAKPILFGTFYGMGPKKYAAQTGISLQAAYAAMEGFFSLYSGLKLGIKRIQQECYERGHVRTLLRRYIEVPNIRSPLDGLRAQAQRQAFNYSIQSSCADLLKMSMLLVHRDERLKELGVKMTLQVHDELLFEVPKGVEQEVRPIIEEYVSHPYRHFGMKDLSVDTPAEMGFGDSWGTAKQ